MAKPWPVPTEMSAELVPAVRMDAHLRHWTYLCARALEPNPFYAPEIALPAALHLPETRGGEVVLAWRGTGETRRLVGLLPIVPARGRHANPFAVRRATAHYGTLSTPLLDPDRPAETWAAMLASLGGAGIRTLVLPFVHEGGPAALALRDACSSRDLRLARLGGHARAFLRSPLGGDAYVRATLEPRRRKEADRQRRRLADLGHLAFEIATGPAEVAAALDEFLALEAAGWKGHAGSALMVAPGGEAFIREAARRGAEAGRFKVATLRCAGRPVAAGLFATAGNRAFYMKTAYDEALARFSPGLLLTLDLTRHLLDDAAIADADSIAVADHPMIDRVWTERFPVETLAVATGLGGDALVAASVAAERIREDAVARLKRGSAVIAEWRTRFGKARARKAEPPASA